MILPEQKFFEPTPAFWDLMDSHAWLRWKRFWDVGAGMGHLTDEMVATGRECVGLDACVRPNQSNLVKLEDVTARYFTPDDCLLVARPCHGDWLRTLFARNAGTAEILYIGLERNFDDDLNGFYTDPLADDVGKDGESVLRITGEVGKAERWCLLDCDFWNSPNWMIDKGSRWENSMGGGFSKDDTEVTVLEEKHLMNYFQEYGPKEQYCSDQEDLDNGWIAPNGEWFPGHSSQHAAILTHVLGITEARAEELGFVRCYGSPHAFWSRRGAGRPTDKQIDRLKELKFDLKRDFEVERSVE